MSERPIGATSGTSPPTRAHDVARRLMVSEVIPANVDTVKAPLAWPYSTGSGARLLIIDTGHDRGHYRLFRSVIALARMAAATTLSPIRMGRRCPGLPSPGRTTA
jgi:hypothetical protein